MMTSGDAGNQSAAGIAGPNGGVLLLSCTISPSESDNPAAALSCINFYADQGPQLAMWKVTYQQACEGQLGTQSTSPCPGANAVGGCTSPSNGAAGGGVYEVEVYYAPDSESAAQMSCTGAMLTFGPYP